MDPLSGSEALLRIQGGDRAAEGPGEIALVRTSKPPISTEIRHVKADRELAKLCERQAHREEGVLTRDLEVLRRLERGARMAEAENR